MLGNMEDYFVINGVNRGVARRKGANVMNNPAGPTVATNYQFLVDAINKRLEMDYRILPVNKK